MATRSKPKKLLEDIHPLHIIREVQKWPLLWSKDNPERANLHFKNKVWREVAKALFTNWDSFSEIEQECKITDVAKRWRNLRDTFKRQLCTEKKIREGHKTKKKTYVYFKHMLFLLPHVNTPDIELSDAVAQPELNEYFTKREKRKSNKERESKRKKTASKALQKKEEIDEDKHFLMSLIPSFKKMSDDEKLTAKVEILKVIKDVRRTSTATECLMPVVDSLTYADGNDVSEIKVEMLESEMNRSSSVSETESDEHSD